jgi:UDPglucose 6-dehydrogenase
MKIAIIGTGFVGVVSAAVYSSLKNQVIGLDIDPLKIESLKKGVVPFFEPGLEKLLIDQQQAGRLQFTTDYKEAISQAELIIIAVGTPSKKSGAVDLSYIFSACKSLTPYLNSEAIIAIKSTVPPGIFVQIEKTKKFYLVSLPEFLKEGTAVANTLHPDRVVIGTNNDRVFKKLTALHQPLKAPIIKVRPESAQMIKYAANAYLATRITFINQVANLCEHNQANIEEVIEGMGYDKRIGNHYWYPGLGYGGSCFPKDVKELAAYAKSKGELDNLMIHLNQLNETRIPNLISKWSKAVNSWKNKRVAILGLSFKPNTNDTRESPASKIVPELLALGAKIKAFDPKAVWQPPNQQNYQQVDSIKTATIEADIILILVEWPEIINFDYLSIKTSKKQFIIDTRNQLKPDLITQAGFSYVSIGRD